MDDFYQIMLQEIVQEAFYQFSKKSKNVQEVNKCLEVRKALWKHNFGVPTIEFLQEYQNSIDEVELQLSKDQFLKIESKKQEKVVYEEPEAKNGFVKTLNTMGYMTPKPSDKITQSFIQFSKGKRVLDIGASFGVATLAAIENGASEVYCNDLDYHHLEIANLKFKKMNSPSKLVLVPGSFPEELDFPENFFDAICIIRVLHFFTGEQIEKSLRLIKKWLKVNGKVFIVNETPYIKNIQKFGVIYEKIKDEMEWPGICDTEKYIEVYTKDLPSFLHLLDEKIMKRELEKAGFYVDTVEYLDRKDFPDSLRLDGRESIGSIGIKRDESFSRPHPLKGIDSSFNQFTYTSIVKRIPAIIDQVIKNNNFQSHINEKLNHLKDQISKGDYICEQDTSRDEWKEYKKLYNLKDYTWLTLPWFYLENFFYHELLEITEYSKNNIDPFESQKKLSLESFLNNKNHYENLCKVLELNQDEILKDMIYFSLWGNLEDLSFSGGNHVSKSLIDNHDKLLIDDTNKILKNKRYKKVVIFLDNCGSELVMDLFLAHVLIINKISDEITFYSKKYPVFVSDVLIKDFHNTINSLIHSNEYKNFGEIFKGYLEKDIWKLCDHPFLTSPLPFWDLPVEIENNLKTSELIIIKGDANYRRCIGDLHWDFTTQIDKVIDYFPSNVLLLRTLKSGVMIGLTKEKQTQLNNNDKDWCVNGTKGVIQYISYSNKHPQK